MDKKAEGLLQIAFAVAIAAAAILFSEDISGLGAYGYAGVFLIAALASATIFFPAPGWAAVVALSGTLDPVLLGVFAGLGSAIGEHTGYIAGDGIRDILSQRIKETKQVEGFVKRYGVGAIFLFAFIPNPLFDIAGLVSGGLKIAWWRFLLACAGGRVLRYILLAMIGAFTLSLV